MVDDGKRTKLANLLLDYGDRIQKSVFEADLSHSEMQEILAKASKYLTSEDSLRLYPLCQECCKGMRLLGSDRAATIPIESLRVI